ncbi:MAG: GNAT family N-acetyltransferase [Alphaproteobacteria bacterium]
MVKMMRGLQAFHGVACVTKAEHFSTYCLGPKALSKAWVAFNGSTPIGFAVARDWMHFPHAKLMRTIDLLYVEEGLRGCGVGKALIATMTKDALKKGVLRLGIGAAKSNRLANELYQTLGFQKGKPYTHQYGIEGKALLKLTKIKT